MSGLTRLETKRRFSAPSHALSICISHARSIRAGSRGASTTAGTRQEKEASNLADQTRPPTSLPEFGGKKTSSFFAGLRPGPRRGCPPRPPGPGPPPRASTPVASQEAVVIPGPARPALAPAASFREARRHQSSRPATKCITRSSQATSTARRTHSAAGQR